MGVDQPVSGGADPDRFCPHRHDGGLDKTLNFQHSGY